MPLPSCAKRTATGSNPPAIERAAEMTPFDQSGSVRRFQKLMERLGVDKALREAGAQEGDTVYIGEYELEYQE